MFKRTLVLGITMLALAGTAATAADAVVLVSRPASSIFCLDPIKLGVWYQAYSGGSRSYRVTLRNPAGNVIFRREGRAPSLGWQVWRPRPINYPGLRHGYSTYKSTYLTNGVRTVFRTQVLCGE